MKTYLSDKEHLLFLYKAAKINFTEADFPLQYRNDEMVVRGEDSTLVFLKLHWQLQEQLD